MSKKEKNIPEAAEGTNEPEKISKKDKKELEAMKAELEELRAELEKVNAEKEKLEKALSEETDKYLRMLAEYDNFRKRSQSEKDALYSESVSDTIGAFLPVIDSLEMALNYNTDGESMVKGVGMTLTQFAAVLEKLGITEIECKTFDPMYHNAVMHIEDETFGEGEIVEVLRKGYKKGEKIIRYAMVKVAN